MAIELLAELRALGVELSIDVDGRLAYDAPAGVIGDDLMGRMRAERDGLLAALAEPAMEDGPAYLLPMPGVLCPWCRSGDYLIEHDPGLRCGNCDRVAWRFEGEAIVRADWVELIEADYSSVSKIGPDKKRAPRIERNGGEQHGLMFEP